MAHAFSKPHPAVPFWHEEHRPGWKLCRASVLGEEELARNAVFRWYKRPGYRTTVVRRELGSRGATLSVWLALVWVRVT